MNSSAHPENQARTADASESTLHTIGQMLNGLRFGQITVIIHEGRVVQIDRTERFRPPSAANSG